jgi:hypothetical protein
MLDPSRDFGDVRGGEDRLPGSIVLALDGSEEAKGAGEGAAEKSLVAVGSRGLGRVQHLRLSSISTKVLRATDGVVLISRHPVMHERPA